jgi:hypothetical protein
MGLSQSIEQRVYRGNFARVVSVGSVVLLAWIIGLGAADSPETIQGITLGLFWAGVLAAVLYHRTKRWPDRIWWWQIILIGLAIRLVFALVHLAVGLQFYRGQVDLVGYHRVAIVHGIGLLRSPLAVLSSAFTMEISDVPPPLLGIFYLFVGPSLPGMLFLSAIVGFIGSYLFLRAFQSGFASERSQPFLAFGFFFFPSLAFWPGLLGKDCWTFFFLGWVTYLFARLFKGFRLRYLLGLGVSLGALGQIRPPLAAATALVGGCVWYFSWRPRGPAAILKPVGLALSVAAVAAVVIGITSAYLRERVQQLELSLSALQSLLNVGIAKHVGLSTDPHAGGSSLDIAIHEASLGALLRYLPEGITTFLFRPIIFEAHHVIAVAAALEGTLFLLLLFWRRRNLIAAMRSMFANPFVAFCIGTFVLLTLMLSFERNLGVIVRHRTMVLPFVMMLMAVPLLPKTMKEPPRRKGEPV